MAGKLLVYILLIAALINIGYPITCYVCMTTSCQDLFKYSDDTSSPLFKYNYGSRYIACVVSENTLRNRLIFLSIY